MLEIRNAKSNFFQLIFSAIKQRSQFLNNTGYNPFDTLYSRKTSQFFSNKQLELINTQPIAASTVKQDKQHDNI